METGADKAVPSEDVANGYVLHPKKTVSVIDTYFFFGGRGWKTAFLLMLAKPSLDCDHHWIAFCMLLLGTSIGNREKPCYYFVFPMKYRRFLNPINLFQFNHASLILALTEPH